MHLYPLGSDRLSQSSGALSPQGADPRSLDQRWTSADGPEARHPLLALVVERPGDETVVRDTLEAHGYAVAVLSRDGDPIAFFEEHHPKVIIFDVTGPSGWPLAVCTALHALAPAWSAPGLIVSARFDPTTAEAARRAGGTVFMSKPFATYVLLDTIGRLRGGAGYSKRAA